MAIRLRFLALILLTLTASACGAGLCGNVVAQQEPSPDGRHVAVVFTRDCGATTGFSNQVAILDAGATLPDRGGNAFVASDSSAVRVYWRADTLIITHAAADPIRAESLVSDVPIRYLKSVPGLSN
jgi:hypothetical protein